MGAERASTIRRREAGEICANCHCGLPYQPRERLCDRCSGKRHRIDMHFMLAGGLWRCQFLEEDARTTLPRRLHFRDPAKIIELAEKGGAAMQLEDRQAIEHGIEIGRGGIWLNLTPEQYQKLKRGSR